MPKGNRYDWQIAYLLRCRSDHGSKMPQSEINTCSASIRLGTLPRRSLQACELEPDIEMRDAHYRLGGPQKRH